MINAIYRILPDGTIWVTEKGGTGRNLAQWKYNYDHQENTPKDGMFGTVWDANTKERFKFDNKTDWAIKVREIYEIDYKFYRSESWYGGITCEGRLSDKTLYPDSNYS